MQDTLINQNQNPNYINQENQIIQGQYQPNQPYMEPHAVTVNQPPYNLSSFQNQNNPNNTTSNQVTQEGYVNPYQNAPYIQFNLLVHGIPFTDTSGQFGAMNFQPKSGYNINYENIKNISEIEHLKFSQPEENTFLISQKWMMFFPIFMLVLGIPYLIVPLFVGIPALFTLYFGGTLFTTIGIIMCIKLVINVYFILGPNNITVKKNAMLRKKTYIFNLEELLRVEFHQNLVDTNKGPRFNYEIVFVKTNGDIEKMYEEKSSPFSFHEIGYFIHIINKHIQTKRSPK